MRVKKKTISKGAAGEKRDAQEIYDVKPMTVGLVGRGANRRAFFLMKNVKGATMNDQGTDQDVELVMDDEPGAEVEELDREEAIAESVVARLQNLLSPLLKRQARNPEAAAQRALGQIGGHPELTAASRLLVEFLENARKRKGYGEKYGYGKYGYGKYGYGYPQPAKKDASEGATKDEQPETGGQSVAQSETAAQPGSAPDLAAAIAEAMKPFHETLSALSQWQKSVDERFAKAEEANAERALAPLAKSLNMSTEVLRALQKNMAPEQFQMLSDQMARWRNAALAGGLFEEIGTSVGSDSSPSQEVLLQKKATSIQDERKVDFAQALVLASMELGFGLEPAMPIREET